MERKKIYFSLTSFIYHKHCYNKSPGLAMKSFTSLNSLINSNETARKTFEFPASLLSCEIKKKAKDERKLKTELNLTNCCIKENLKFNTTLTFFI